MSGNEHAKMPLKQEIRRTKYQYIMPQNEIHIGSLIRKKLKEDGRAASWLAKKINCERSNIYKIFNKSSIDTSLLQKIGTVLETNFFSYYSEYKQSNDDKVEKK